MKYFWFQNSKNKHDNTLKRLRKYTEGHKNANNNITYKLLAIKTTAFWEKQIWTNDLEMISEQLKKQLIFLNA